MLLIPEYPGEVCITHFPSSQIEFGDPSQIIGEVVREMVGDDIDDGVDVGDLQLHPEGDIVFITRRI